MMRETVPRLKMLGILEKLRRWWHPQTRKAGAPRRLKQYSAQTGFQYEYQLVKSVPGDYEFAIWTAAHPVTNIQIQVPIAGLTARDRYALAKLNLFRAFDELPPVDLPPLLTVTDTALLDELASGGVS
jgi:hypothetical protein